MARIRKRQALDSLRHGTDPTARLRKQTASPFLCILGHLLTIAAAAAAYQHVHYVTPAGLLALAAAIILFIVLRKPCSHHHAALLFIVVFLTLAFGVIHYSPLFQHAP